MSFRCELPINARYHRTVPSIDTHAQEQIDDICVKSKEMWERQAAARAQSNPEKPLKRPLHQPVVISKAGSSDSSRRKGPDRWRNESGRRYEERRRD